jgi:hypothetical protein
MANQDVKAARALRLAAAANRLANQSAGGGADHGSLTGKADDDHPQYHNDARGDARYYTQAQVDAAISAGGGGSFIGARAYVDSNYSLASSSAEAVAFDAESYDTDGIHDNSTENSRFTAQTAGYYAVHAQIRFAGSGFSALVLQANGDTTIGTTALGASLGSSARYSVHAVWFLDVGDYVEVLATKASGSLVVEADDTWMAVHKL